MKKVSIIVPVYNVENYISHCIESLINQTYKNIEIILIDDGSTDLSGKICDDYAKKDTRVNVIHKENSGVSSTRNLGVKLSTGYYIMFVDSDDYVKKDFVKKMVSNIHNNDMCVCGYIEQYINKSKNFKLCEEYSIIHNQKAIDLIFIDQSFGGYLWNKIFLSEIIKKNGLEFNSKVHMCEDVLFVIQYLVNCNKVKCIFDELYFYKMRKSSMVWNIKSKKYQSMFLAYDKMIKILKENNIDDFNCRFELLIFTFKNKIKISKLDNTIDFNFYNEFKKCIKDKNISKKMRLKLIIYRYFNVVYQIYMSIKKHRYGQYF